jgi:uncharacterized membrane protein
LLKFLPPASSVETRAEEVLALGRLSSGFLYLVAAWAATTAGAVGAALALILSAHAAADTGAGRTLPGVRELASAALPFIALLVAGAAAAVYAVACRIRPGMRALARVDRSFGVCHAGTAIWLIGTGIFALGAAALAAAALSAEAGPPPRWSLILGRQAFSLLLGTLALTAIGGIVAVVGHVMTFAVGAFRLHGRYENSLYMAAGILYAVDLALLLLGLGGVLTLVGHVLMRIALRDTVRKLLAEAQRGAG